MWKGNCSSKITRIVFTLIKIRNIQEPELGEGKDASSISQYPLEDLLDKFGVYISDFYKSENDAGKDTCYLEFASSDAKDIINLLTIINKHVYNRNVIIDGEETVTLIIE